MYKAKSLDREIQVTDLYIFYVVNLCVTLTHYAKYGIHPSYSLQGISQNHLNHEI